MRRKPAVLLDRDGVINKDSYDYVKSYKEFHFRPEALAALRRLREAGAEVYIITNQSGVARGYFSEPMLNHILANLKLEVRQSGGLIHGVQYCPFHPDDGSYLRKPNPGMLLKAAAKWGLDLSKSVFVGDSYSDIDAGHAAGCQTIFLTTRRELPDREGRLPGPEQVKDHLQRAENEPDYIADSLTGAVDIILDMPQFSGK
ncbi:MAG: HAD family hydrolase [Armatimonadota bacterium]